MRLFIALNFSDTARQEILAAMNRLREHSTAGNFSRSENLHLTLAFLGEIPPDRIPKLREILTKCAGKASPFSLSFHHLDYFPGKGQEKLWYLTCVKTPQLDSFVSRLHNCLTKSGFYLEEREFIPHVTLGRRCITESVPEITPITAAFHTMELMLSQRIEGVLTYTPIFSAQFIK